jgi:putative selenium metabolism protein SsnA
MIIHNALVLTFDEDQRVFGKGAVRYSDGVITHVAEDADALIAAFPEDERWNAHGMILMPGQICSHTHFYGAFARGMYIPGAPARDFPEILRKLWWPLDRALDLDGVRSSAEVCLVDAIRNGTTTLIDHHASQTAIDGSLDAIAESVLQSGLRACLCYEVTDRDGAAAAQAGIAENLRFMRRIDKVRGEHAGSALATRLAATFGLHASMTLGDETLEQCAASANRFHVHVAEHPADEEASLARSGKRVIERLAAFGIAGPETIMAHCIHIDAWEMELLRDSDTWVSHQPRSNMNNAVGAARVEEMMRGGIAVCLGNDGFSNDMFAEMKVADMLQKVTQGDPRALGADKVIQMAVHNNRALAGDFFERPVGVLEEGAWADMILLDHYPTTPISSANLPWVILFGFSGGQVNSTIVQGSILMRDRKLLTMDEGEISERSQRTAAATWERYWKSFESH